MTTKWTKGPWQVREMQGYAKQGWREVFSLNGSPVVCVGSFERHSGGETETHCGVQVDIADAQLIASAPDLYARLQEMIEAFVPRNVRQAEAMDAAVLTLRAARGEQ